MFKETLVKFAGRPAGWWRGAIPLTLILLGIEFYDELAYSVDGAALPSLRAELGLSYAQVGLLFGLPGVINILIEPAILLLGDTGLRKLLVVVGGFGFALAMSLVAAAQSFPVVLLAMLLAYPTSGAFVTLSQATLMDYNRGREEHWMARWTLAGSMGTLIGPLLLAGGLALDWGWRWAFAILAILAVLLSLAAWVSPFPRRHHPDEADQEVLPTGRLLLLKGFLEAARNPRLLRWILLVQMADLMLDVFAGYVPLYFTDVVGLTPVQASLVFGLFMLANLAADSLLIPLLDRFSGQTVVRTSAILVACLYTAWLAVPWVAVKVALVIAIRLATLGWYQVLQGEAFAAIPGRSGTVTAVGSMVGLLGSGLAWLVGWVAGLAGLPVAMWLLLLGPVSLILFVPRGRYAHKR